MTCLEKALKCEIYGIYNERKGGEQMYDNDILYWMWLKSMPGVGSVTMMNLYNSFGSIEKVYMNEDANRYSFVDKIKPSVANMLAQNKDLSELERLLDYMRESDIKYITIEDNDYPKLLKEIYDYPPVLFYKGENILSDNIPKIAMVGSRNASNYGLNVARQFAKIFSDNGLDVVSGLALGIDAASHLGALDGRGDTIGVLGCGVDRIYPARNRVVYERIINEGGMVISEHLPGTAPKAEFFPARNRIISGLCYGTLVVEASYKSGSLITARCANEQGRNVYAIPGNITSKISGGCNRLIKDGAGIVLNVKDVFEDLYYVLKSLPNNKDLNIKKMEDASKIKNFSVNEENVKDIEFKKEKREENYGIKQNNFIEKFDLSEDERKVLIQISNGSNTADLICKNTNLYDIIHSLTKLLLIQYFYF